MKYEKEITTDNFWDCECEENYIHFKTETKCNKCGVFAEDMPDSRIVEVKEYFEKQIPDSIIVGYYQGYPIWYDTVNGNLWFSDGEGAEIGFAEHYKKIINQIMELKWTGTKNVGYRLKIKPAEPQAKIWVETMKKYGKRPYSYVDAINKQLYLWED